MGSWLEIARRELFLRAEDRFSALDGMRAMAALLIVAFHSYVSVAHAAGISTVETPAGAIQSMFARSWIGVDIFFVLSGFLIGRILFLQLLRAGSIDFRRFYLRRALRIFPAYYVVLTLSLFALSHLQVFAFMYRGAEWRELLQRSPANYLYLSNYMHGGTIPNALGLSWSLCIEEHFYLLMPALLAIVFRTVDGRLRLGILLALSALPMLARSLAYVRNPQIVILNGLYWNSHTHADGLFLGVAGAYCFVFEREALGRMVRELNSFIWIAGAICFASIYEWGGEFTRGVFAVVFQFMVLAIGSTLLALDGLLLDNVAARFFAHRAWYPVARLSYGLYLVHLFAILLLLAVWPVAAADTLQSGAQLSLFAGCAAALGLTAAALLFFTVERPMLKWGERIMTRDKRSPTGRS